MRESWRYRGAVALAPLVAALLAAGLPAAANAQRLGGQEMARVATHAGGVDFAPSVRYQAAILTISGNGATYRHEIPAGRYLAIDAYAPDGKLLADGHYTWRLELVPNADMAATLRAEAKENGGTPTTRWAAQSGAFTIVGGAFADPSLTESTARAADRESPGLAAATPSTWGSSRQPAADDDAAVGFREEFEAEMSAAAARQAPQAGAPGALAGPDRVGDDTDAVARALGASPERSPEIVQQQTQAQTRGATARPRSDGSNGRPRSQ